MNQSANMRIGGWRVLPAQNLVECDGHSIKIEPRAMELLVYLARHGGEVVSNDDLIREVWHGRAFGDGVVYKKIISFARRSGTTRATRDS